MDIELPVIKAVLDAAYNVACDQNQGHFLILKALESAHSTAVNPANLERVQHELKTSHSIHEVWNEKKQSSLLSKLCNLLRK